MCYVEHLLNHALLHVSERSGFNIVYLFSRILSLYTIKETEKNTYVSLGRKREAAFSTFSHKLAKIESNFAYSRTLFLLESKTIDIFIYTADNSLTV